MPSASKTRWSQLKVGVMALVALLILGYLLILMTGDKGLFESSVEVFTYMDDSAALADGAPVTLNGINVGKVRHAGLSGSAEANRVVRVTMQINDAFLTSIPVDSVAAIAAANLLGVKYINIKKGMRPETIKAGAELKSLDTREIQDIVQQGYSTMAALQGIVNRVDGILSQIELGKGPIGKLLVDEAMAKKIDSITDELLKLSQTMNNKDSSLGKLLNDDKLYEDYRGMATRINVLVDGLNNGEGTLGKLFRDDSLLNDFRGVIADTRVTLKRMDDLVKDVNDGKGTVGKLFKSEEFHDQMKATLGRLDTMMDKINSGEGTLGQMLVNPQLYESLDGTTREIQSLMKDFRANPKKFLTIQLKLF